jgi:hypothetical protein
LSIVLALVIAGSGIATGWIARGALDRALTAVLIRVLADTAGKEEVAKGLKRYINESGSGNGGASERREG